MVLLIEFLNRISFFSILSWSFFLLSVSCAILLTAFRSPLIRRYRRVLIGVTWSSIVLGVLSWSVPFFTSRLHPDQSRLVAMDSLARTEWVEPLGNPETQLPPDEIGLTRKLPYRFKYKLKLPFEFDRVLTAEAKNLVVRDRSGNIRGFDAYTGFNHWSIRLHTHRILGTVETPNRLFILDRTSLDSFRISSIDLQNPSLLWQRNIPNCREGHLAYDSESQSILVTTGNQGVWSLKARSGEILWKRPELYSKSRPLPMNGQVAIFEPEVANRKGWWQVLDSHSGRTLRKLRHAFDETTELVSDASAPLILLKTGAQEYASLNPLTFERLWMLQVPAPLLKLASLDRQTYLAWQTSGRVEVRNWLDNSMVWQQQLSDFSDQFVRSSPDHQMLAFSMHEPNELAGVAFRDQRQGQHLASVQTSEPLQDLWFLGDWLYLFSQNHVWSFRK